MRSRPERSGVLMLLSIGSSRTSSSVQELDDILLALYPVQASAWHSAGKVAHGCAILFQAAPGDASTALHVTSKPECCPSVAHTTYSGRDTHWAVHLKQRMRRCGMVRARARVPCSKFAWLDRTAVTIPSCLYDAYQIREELVGARHGFEGLMLPLPATRSLAGETRVGVRDMLIRYPRNNTRPQQTTMMDRC